MNAVAPHAILVVEDDRTLNTLLCDHLAEIGHTVRGVSSRAEAMARLGSYAPDLALLDVHLPDCDGLSFLPELREYCPVIVLTAFGSIDQAVNAVKRGASEYLVKPVNFDSLEIAVNRVFETVALRRDLDFWRSEAQRLNSFEMIGDSPALAELRHMVGLLAATDSPVLITGEPGTGKSVAAAAIHSQGPRANGRFITVDCDPEMLESELFGKVRDARYFEGLLAAAENGTIFLSDVEKLSGPLQGRLLRVLEQGSYRPHGSNTAIATNARIITASAVDLEAASREGRVRPQLFYHLSGFALNVPPLRDRPADIEPLARWLLDNRSFQRGVDKQFAPEALAVLRAHDWPGNIRELANVVDRGVMLSAGQPVISPAHLSIDHHAPVNGHSDQAVRLVFDAPPKLDTLRDAYIAQLLDRLDGNRQRIAETLGISERNLYRLLKAMPEKDEE